jgi:ABC-2 type transport system ATP-binding protein
MPSVLTTEALTRRFGSRVAVDSVDLDVREGDVYGLLGLNGAGKTTTMRMILQLIRPTSGRVRLFGRDASIFFRECMREVGSLVEHPAYYPYLSARQNLEVIRLMSIDVPERRIDEVLEQVGLAERRRDRVSTFSQGMRQRLGIAMAILTKPKLVILDEPTNGLDPQGIKQIRETILEMNKKDGITFVISSHLLHEIEVTCTRVGMIKAGKLIVQEEIEKLLASTTHGVRVRTPEPQRALQVLRSAPGVMDAWVEDERSVRATLSKREFPPLNAALVGAGIPVEEFSPIRLTLEELFLLR